MQSLELMCAWCSYNKSVLTAMSAYFNLLFLNQRNLDISFVNCFLQVCSAILDNKSLANIYHDNHNDKLKVLEGHVPEFENLLALTQGATAVAKSCCELKFVFQSVQRS